MGRPKKVQPVIETTAAQVEQPVAKETAVRKKTRTPISGARNVLTVKGKEPGFHYRIVNDVGDRIDMFKEAGYEVVTHEAKIGDRRLAQPSKLGAAATTHVGNGVQGVLMRIPQEWYDEDQEAKENKLRETEDAMSSSDADYGSLKIKRD